MQAPLDRPVTFTFRRRPQERKAWWPRLRDYMGKDIMSLMSVPVFIMVGDSPTKLSTLTAVSLQAPSCDGRPRWRQLMLRVIA